MLNKFIAKQFKKPSGFFGKLCANLMDNGNLLAMNWVCSLLDVKKNETILEIGYGSGILINKIADLNQENLIYGLDFSDIMYQRALRNCRENIEKKIVKLFNGDLVNFHNDVQFDKIIAINVIYFWNDLNVYFSYIYRLLNNKGKVYLYFPDPKELVKIKFAQTDIFNKYTKEDVVTELEKANFKNIRVETGKTNMSPAYCAIAEK